MSLCLSFISLGSGLPCLEPWGWGSGAGAGGWGPGWQGEVQVGGGGGPPRRFSVADCEPFPKHTLNGFLLDGRSRGLDLWGQRLTVLR